MYNYSRLFKIILDNLIECRRLRGRYGYADDPALDDIEALLYAAIQNADSGLLPMHDLRVLRKAIKEVSI